MKSFPVGLQIFRAMKKLSDDYTKNSASYFRVQNECDSDERSQVWCTSLLWDYKFVVPIKNSSLYFSR